jgi:hypothetical protein
MEVSASWVMALALEGDDVIFWYVYTCGMSKMKIKLIC